MDLELKEFQDLFLLQQGHAEALLRDSSAQAIVEPKLLSRFFRGKIQKPDARVFDDRRYDLGDVRCDEGQRPGLSSEASEYRERRISGVVDVGSAEGLVNHSDDRSVITESLGERADTSHLGEIKALSGT